LIKRIIKIYLITGKTFGNWFSPFLIGLALFSLRTIVGLGRLIDRLIFSSINKPIKPPIIIVGNPRSGTTFLHRFLVNQKLGTGSQLWQLIYPSVVIQKIIRPILPILEYISPAKHHSTEAHKTSLTSVETDDVSLLFRFFDGFFVYGFFLTFDDKDLFKWVDPKINDTHRRDFKWFESIWKRTLITNNSETYIGKLFSLSANLPDFQRKFPDAKIIYIIRDPLNVLPSGLSLVTGVLDKKFNFWKLDSKIRSRFIKRLYNALVELLNRFHYDWINENIDKKNVYIVQYDKMMNDFESLMEDIIKFLGLSGSESLKKVIAQTSTKQKNYKSNHKYDLAKFELTEKQIMTDCKNIYETFLK
tara:strand:+ start:315 stop:1394 length:1080 start_codon:yes stop_codon:yes gene_type:complete